jgi:hypothetical protein
MNRLQFLATAAAGLVSPSLLKSEELHPIPPVVDLKYPELSEGEIKLEMRERDAVAEINLNPPLIGEGEDAVLNVDLYQRMLQENKGKVRIIVTAMGRFGGVLKHKGWISPSIEASQKQDTLKTLMGHITEDWLKQRDSA